MTQETFNRILTTDARLDPAQTKELNLLLERFPYFQAAHALRLKGLHQSHSFSYNAALKKTAAYTTDRSVLFDYITSEEFKQHGISEQLKARQKKAKTEDFDQAIRMDQEDAGKVLDPDLFEKPENDDETLPAEKPATPKKQALDFDKSEAHSFSDWLKLTAAKPISRQEKPDENAEKPTRKNAIIDKFIENNPKITPSPRPENQVAIKNDAPGKHLMTETLAKIYAEQKNYDKAIQAYKILILKNPEKSGLFADRIRAIETSKENKKQ